MYVKLVSNIFEFAKVQKGLRNLLLFGTADNRKAIFSSNNLLCFYCLGQANKASLQSVRRAMLVLRHGSLYLINQKQE